MPSFKKPIQISRQEGVSWEPSGSHFDHILYHVQALSLWKAPSRADGFSQATDMFGFLSTSFQPTEDKLELTFVTTFSNFKSVTSELVTLLCKTFQAGKLQAVGWGSHDAPVSGLPGCILTHVHRV